MARNHLERPCFVSLPPSFGELTSGLVFAHCWFANTEIDHRFNEVLLALGEAVITNINPETNELTIKTRGEVPSFELPVGFAAWVQRVIKEFAALPLCIQRARFEFGQRHTFKVAITFEGEQAIARVGVVVISGAETRKAA